MLRDLGAAALGGIGALALPRLLLALGATSTAACSTHSDAAMPRTAHPAPRPGVTAAGVLAEADVPEKSRAAYAAAHEIPQVLDGLYCHCHCDDRDGMRSLLSCFETRMPISCGYCREAAELAVKMHRDGHTLDQIRAAVDREFGN